MFESAVTKKNAIIIGRTIGESDCQYTLASRKPLHQLHHPQQPRNSACLESRLIQTMSMIALACFVHVRNAAFVTGFIVPPNNGVVTPSMQYVSVPSGIRSPSVVASRSPLSTPPRNSHYSHSSSSLSLFSIFGGNENTIQPYTPFVQPVSFAHRKLQQQQQQQQQQHQQQKTRNQRKKQHRSSLSNKNTYVLNNRHSASDWFYNVKSLPHSRVLREIRYPVIASATWAAFVSVLYCIGQSASTSSMLLRRFTAGMTIPTTAHGFLVSALGLLLVFRTNSAYQRFYVSSPVALCCD
jgi:GH24 family phage-related lysozyme (muramidase)